MIEFSPWPPEFADRYRAAGYWIDQPLTRILETQLVVDPTAEALEPLRASLATEADPTLKAQKERLERFLTLRFDPDPAARVAAIESLGADISLDTRAALNPLVATTRTAFAGEPEGNVARELTLGRDLTEAEAYDLLVARGLAARTRQPV